tara:strand:- start:2406 stop:2870 length:465 start_codon:yes stop_codon:yes gene_type:complete
MAQAEFEKLITVVAETLVGQKIEPNLATKLEKAFPVNGEIFKSLVALCREGIEEGWLCDRELDGIKYGRVIKPTPESFGFSVDVVEMSDIVGPLHSHPNGEIDMIMPEVKGVEFDGHGEGWVVYGPGSVHSPTVTGGKAIVLYLLPDGVIKFLR